MTILYRKAPKKKKTAKRKSAPPGHYYDSLGNLMQEHPPGCTCGSSITRC